MHKSESKIQRDRVHERRIEENNHFCPLKRKERIVASSHHLKLLLSSSFFLCRGCSSSALFLPLGQHFGSMLPIDALNQTNGAKMPPPTLLPKLFLSEEEQKRHTNTQTNQQVSNEKWKENASNFENAIYREGQNAKLMSHGDL
jgi:hypothetical protein